MWVELDGTVMLFLAINGFGHLRACPDENVSVPDGGHSELRVGGDFDLDIADLVFNRGETRFLRERKERPLHRVLLIPDRDVGKCGYEQVGLGISSGRQALGHNVSEIAGAFSMPGTLLRFCGIVKHAIAVRAASSSRLRPIAVGQPADLMLFDWEQGGEVKVRETL